MQNIGIDRQHGVVVIALNGFGKTALSRIFAGEETPDMGIFQTGQGFKIGFCIVGHETPNVYMRVLRDTQYSAPQLAGTDAQKVLGLFLFAGDYVDKPGGVFSGGEKTRWAPATLVVSGAKVLLLDEPTNNLDPSSREEILRALATFYGELVLVSHDVGAVTALNPERVPILPGGDEDHWNEGYGELILFS